MLDHLERATRSAQHVELQAPAGFSRADLISSVQTRDIVDDTTSGATNKDRANVATLGISDSFQRLVQSCFQLRPIRGSTERRDIARSSSSHARDDAFHRVQRLTILGAHELLTEEQSLFNGHCVQSSAILFAFANIASTSNLRNSSSSLGDSPAVAEDLRVVDVTISNDRNSRRTHRTFFKRIANGVQVIIVKQRSGSNSANSARDSDRRGRRRGVHHHHFTRAINTNQVARHHIGVGVHGKRGITRRVAATIVDLHKREDHGLGEVAVLDVAGSLILEESSQAKQGSSTIRHQPSDSLGKTDRIQIGRCICRRKKSNSHFSSFRASALIEGKKKNQSLWEHLQLEPLRAWEQ